MKTKFTIKSVFPLLFLPIFLYLSINTSLLFFNDFYYEDKFFPKIFLPFILIFSLLTNFGEVKTKVISVEIGQSEIIVKKFLGLRTIIYHVSEIEGWKFSYNISRGSTYEYLYLYKNGERIIIISQFYHRNYDEIKRLVRTKFRDLGYERFSYIDELKEIFK